jgi:hypothetical protein
MDDQEENLSHNHSTRNQDNETEQSGRTEEANWEPEAEKWDMRKYWRNEEEMRLLRRNLTFITWVCQIEKK